MACPFTIVNQARVSTCRMREDEKLSLLLNAAFMEFPVLLDELPQMLHALDEGECIAVDRISDAAKREYITNIFTSIPLLRKKPEYGWHKQERDISARSFLLAAMMDSGKIIEPRDLTQAQQQATRSIPMHLMKLFQSYPALRDELPQLLEQLLDGNDMQLDSLGDDDLAESLEKFLRSLGMVVKRENICIPEEDYSTVRRSLKAVFNVFVDYDEYHYQLRKSKKNDEKSKKSSSKDSKKEQHKKKSRHSKDDSSSTSSSSSESDSDAESCGNSVDSVTNQNRISLSDNRDTTSPNVQDQNSENCLTSIKDPNSEGVRRQGPARPSEAEMQLAAQMAVNYEESDDQEDDDDGFGPKLVKPSSSYHSAPAPVAMPLGFVGIDSTASLTNDEEANLVGRKRERDSETKVSDSADQLKREEWILEPGESQALNALGGGGNSAIDPLALFGKSRKFQTGKQAKKNAEAVIIQREYARSLMQQEAEKRREELGNAGEVQGDGEYTEEVASRPLSLMEEHLAKRQRLQEEKKGQPQERRPFDRERDVLSRRNVGDAEMFQLVKNAKELTGRFDQPVVQKSFL